MAQRYKFSIESKSFPLDISGEPFLGLVFVNAVHDECNCIDAQKIVGEATV